VRRVLLATAFFAGLFGLWQAVASSGWVNEALLPPPTRVAAYFAKSVRDGSFLDATLVTVRRLVVGYAIGLSLGLPLGFLTARVQTARDTIGVMALGLQTLPSVCWAPIAMGWFGQTETAMLFVVVMGTAWSILLATEHGVRAVPPLYVRAARTMGSRGLHTIGRVVLPAALPFVTSGMKQGWAFAWRSLMAAEIYVTILTGVGLGQILHYGREEMRYDKMFGVMLVIVVVGLVADRAIFGPVERALHRRWGTGRAP
jgi:NitT/TauT family transport system permease protein